MKKLLIAATTVLALMASGFAIVLATQDSSSPTGASAAGALQQQQAADAPWLGAALVLTPDGVAVGQVAADSPADKAGLQRGDVIQSIDGTAVDTVREFVEQVKDKQVGDTVTLTISRDGQTQTVSVTLEARPEPLPRAIPMLPELEGITPSELFSHIQGGELRFTDANGNAVTAVLEAGTVAGVDADAGTLSVDLNAGGSETYTVEEDDIVFKGGLSELAQGDNVVVMTVNGDVRAVMGGRGLPIPGLGGMHRGPGHGRFGGGFEGRGPGPFAGPEEAPPADVPDTGM